MYNCIRGSLVLRANNFCKNKEWWWFSASKCNVHADAICFSIFSLSDFPSSSNIDLLDIFSNKITKERNEVLYEKVIAYFTDKEKKQCTPFAARVKLDKELKDFVLGKNSNK